MVWEGGLCPPIPIYPSVGERQRGSALILQKSLVSALFRPLLAQGETVGDQVLVNLGVESQLSRPYRRIWLMVNEKAFHLNCERPSPGV